MSTIDAPGLYGIDAESYHGDPCPTPSLSNSLLKVLLTQTCRQAYLAHPRLNRHYKPAVTRRLELGTVAHRLLLGAGREYKIIDSDSYRSAKAQALRDAAYEVGMIPILVGDFETADAMRRAALEQLAEQDLAEAFAPAIGQTEIMAAAIDPQTCVWCRCLLDRLIQPADEGRPIEVWDYKTHDGALHPGALERHFEAMFYDTQAAIARHCLELLHPEWSGRIAHRFLFQDVNEPYLIQIVEPMGATLTMGAKRLRYGLELWAQCLTTGNWPGYVKGVMPIGYPSFAEGAWLARETADDMLRHSGTEPFDCLVPCSAGGDARARTSLALAAASAR